MNFSHHPPPRWNEVTAIFGGRFDPPHLGHREAVRGLFNYPGVKQVWVIPCGSPPHKPTRVSAENRLAMARINFSAAQNNPFPRDVKIETLELERALLNPNQPSYTYDTLTQLRPHFPHLACVIGADQLDQLFTWHRFPELLAQSHWIILERKPQGSEIARRTLQEWEASGLVRPMHSNLWQITGANVFLHLVPTDAMPLCSTQIRETLSRTGTPPQDALLPEIDGYLKTHQLYGI